MRRTLFLMLLTMLLLVSCGNKVYDKYHHTPISGWEKNDTLTFDLPSITAPAVYSLDLGLRTTRTYPFTSLTLIVERWEYPGPTVKADTLTCKLIDNNGVPKGDGVSYYQYQFHVTDLSLVPLDSLHISVRHDMKREILPGVSDVGIILSRKY